MAEISDGWKSCVYQPGPWRPMRYEGEYRNGCRVGLWRVTDADTGAPRWGTTWSAGEWHGPTRSWYPNGQLEHEGEYAHGQLSGRWTFWFETGQVAAEGAYLDDREVGAWQYWNKEGCATAREEWEHDYNDY
jgi:antitoxin component YwqK of YwqJK toxin-antitoxin module